MQLFKNAAFTKLFLANFASQLGTVVGNMAFAFYLLDRFGSQPYYATVAELMYSLPTLAVFLFVGVLADRLDRKRIAANSDWIRAGLTLLLLLAVHWNWLVPAFVVLFIRSAVSKFFAPAEMSLLQGIMNEEQYVQAAGLNQTVMGLFMLFGMGLGAGAYHYFGIEGAVTIDGISFLASGALIALCRFAPEVRQPNGKVRIRDLSMRLIVADFRQGFTYIRKHKLLFAIIAGFFLFGIVNGVFAVLPIFTMKYKLSPEHYQSYSALITVFLGIGFLLGSAAGAPLIKRFTKVRVLIAGLLLSGALTLALGMTSNVWLYLSLVLAVGAVLAPVNVVLGGWIPELVEASSMGRVSAWIEPLMMMGQSLALGLVALAFPAVVSVTMLYTIVGVCILAAGGYYWIALPALSRKQEAVAGA
ncbi:MFS transporter [Paenibacillus sp. MBLB4367]|uniref:MFS transporter n=1 Tax=Paenibacillus sp. MBLB4367 TaxID=3384767 RepID=UPI0039082291